jgi:putative spermidine/putrescine transport system ATP-binding protein
VIDVIVYHHALGLTAGVQEFAERLMAAGHRVMVPDLYDMSEGAVRQIGTQRDLYERPTDSFVAGFVGRSSFIQGESDPANGFRSEGGLQIRCDRRASGPAVLALRPERVAVAREPLRTDNDFAAEVEFVSYLGGLIDIHTRLSPVDRVIAQVPNSAGTMVPEVGDPVHVGWSASAAFLFQDDGMKSETETSSARGGHA